MLVRPSPVPKSSGVYAWYLREVPRGVPSADCIQSNGLTLLYVGIAPRPPAKNGRSSTRTLRSRLRQHYALNAAGSTLRLTLGCLLAQQLEGGGRASAPAHLLFASRDAWRTGEGDSGLSRSPSLTTTQRYMHLSPAAVEGAIRLLEQPAPHRNGDIVETMEASAAK